MSLGHIPSFRLPNFENRFWVLPATNQEERGPSFMLHSQTTTTFFSFISRRLLLFFFLLDRENKVYYFSFLLCFVCGFAYLTYPPPSTKPFRTMPAKTASLSVKGLHKSPTTTEKADDAMINLPNTGLDSALVKRAVQALLKHHEKQGEKLEKKSLLGTDRPLQVQFTLQRVPGNSSPKPIRVMIPHPLFQLAESPDDEVEEPEICLIVKEESKPWVQEMIEKFPEHMGCIKKVLGLQSLRKKHAQYQQQRELLSRFNLFLADDRILPMLSKALGKTFFKAKKLPIPISLTRKEALPFAVQKALSATFMTISDGTCITIRAGHTGMSPNKLIENVVAIAENAVPKIPRKWTNIQMIGIKTPESVSLPIYNKTPEALAELAKLAGYTTKTKQEDDDGEEDTSIPSKRKLAAEVIKSPLVRALKKQKQIEAEEEKGKKQKTNDITSSAVKETTPKDKKKKRKSSDADTNEPEEEKSPKRNQKDSPSSSKGKDNDDKETPKQKEKKSKRKSSEGTTGAESSSATKKKKEVEKKDTPSKEKKEFIVAKKFTGSKKGYVFRMGRQGLGYYIDIKPVVDRMAMEALKRSTRQQGRRSGGGGGGSKKNKHRGSRRSY